MRYDPERHIPISETAWDKDLATITIKSNLENIFQNKNKKTNLWIIHPNDQFENAPDSLTDFYMGAAGIVWGLYKLNSLYVPTNNIDYSKLIDSVLTEHIKLSTSNNYPNYEDLGSYFVGLAGVRLIKHVIYPEIENEKEIIRLIESKINSDENELLYGLPGLLLIVNHLLKITNNPELNNLQNTILEKLLSTRELDIASGALVWSQDFGKKVKYFGAAHGSIGNYSILLKTLTNQEQNQKTNHYRTDIISNVEKLLKHYAQTSEDQCNWPNIIDSEKAVKYLIHWCHGATGIITELAQEITPKESSVIDDLLLKAGNLVWHAGPLKKGTSLCHGTSGSGMACLKLYKRTKNIIWLERAQAFAMHAIEQHKDELNKYGQNRFSLWTGDLGFLWFLHCVIQQEAKMPGIDLI